MGTRQAVRAMVTVGGDSVGAGVYLPDQAGEEKKKTLINSVFERLGLIGGQIRHYPPRPWAKGFF